MSTVSSFEGEERKSKGAVLFTGPDGIGDYRTKVEEQRFIGHGSMSPESSSDTQYLYRAAQNCPHPPSKSGKVGEVGWGLPSLTDTSLLKSDHQIKLKVFRQAAEDRHTHLYQNPYYPPPSSSAKKSSLKNKKLEGTDPTNPANGDNDELSEGASTSRHSTSSLEARRQPNN